MRLLVAIALTLSIGCNRSRGEGHGNCVEIVDHAIEIGIAEQSEGMSPEQRDRLAERVASRRAEAIEECENRKPSVDEERCALAASTLAEMNACK